MRAGLQRTGRVARPNKLAWDRAAWEKALRDIPDFGAAEEPMPDTLHVVRRELGVDTTVVVLCNPREVRAVFGRLSNQAFVKLTGPSG